MGEGTLRSSLYLFPEVLADSPICFSSHFSLYCCTFLGDVIPVLYSHQETFNGIASHEWTRIPTLPQMLLTLAETSSVGYHHVDAVVAAIVFGTGGIIPGAELELCMALFEVVLALNQLRAHGRYLNLARAFLMCSSSLSSSWG